MYKFNNDKKNLENSENPNTSNSLAHSWKLVQTSYVYSYCASSISAYT